MKSKSIIGAALAAVVTLGVTTSCEDMFDIDSSRVVIEEEHDLNSSADSAYSTIGVLQSLRQIADRYVILGEVRGDLIEINENTKTSLRNLSEFNFEDENEYLKVKDYYAIINNCNYVLAKMDTTISHNNERVMIDEYAALVGVRAWTYLQLAINHGKVPFYLNPITTVADSEKDYPQMDVTEIAAVMIPQLIPYVDYDLPVFTHRYAYPPLQLVLADYYLWSGDYANACATYLDFMTTHEDFNYSYGDQTNRETFRGYMGFDGASLKGSQRGDQLNISTNNWIAYKSSVNTENLAFIPMEFTSANGIVSEVGSLFVSADKTHSLNPSTYLRDLSSKQAYIKATINEKDQTEDGGYSVISIAGDLRYKYYLSYPIGSDREFQVYDKNASYSVPDGVNIEITTPQIVLYRRAITYLRAAEALNSWAKETGNRTHAVMAFNLMKDAYKVFFPQGHVLEKDLRKVFIGVHARGCGDVRLDTTHFALKPATIAQRFELVDSTVTFNDSIRFIDELIIDELAMESACEGNRFGDLVRFAKRRQAWGEANYQDLLAKRVASRKGEKNFDDEIYNKLKNEDNWFLPLK